MATTARGATKTTGQPVCRHIFLYGAWARTGHEPCASTYRSVVPGKCNSLTCEKLPPPAIVGSSPRQGKSGGKGGPHGCCRNRCPAPRLLGRSTYAPATPVRPTATAPAPRNATGGCGLWRCLGCPAGQQEGEKDPQGPSARGSSRNIRANGQRSRACCDGRRLGRLPIAVYKAATGRVLSGDPGQHMCQTKLNGLR